ncbi:MAG: mechanosensitive ion channel family protein [Acidiphilium sp.]|nr:mechanosensitive ion channel family protein [Acidiphilium sp.]MDD4935081.1 mechanosensitive ion channel family protein [Acidiphilium sp.]
MTNDLSHLISRLPNPLILAGAFLVAGVLATPFLFRNRPVGRFIGQVAAFAGFSIMLLVAKVIPSEPTPAIDGTVQFVVISVFKIVWWLAASWLVVDLFHALFKKHLRETRFVQDIVAGAVYITAVLAIISYVFNVPIRGLLAASGVIAIVLGLALQSTLGDVFSGIVLNIAKPYYVGDWVIFGDGLQGRVIETTWRATQILTLSNDLATIPNSLIAKGKLVNASHPTKAHGLTIVIRLEPLMAPSHECAVLETALLSCNRILRTPAPTVAIRTLDAVALECELQFFVSAVENGPEAQNELFDLVHRHCAAAGIRLAPPPESPIALPPRTIRQDPRDMPRRLLENLPIFGPLSDDERIALAPKLMRHIYKAGEVVAEPGTVAQQLSILTTGVLVALQDGGAEEGEVVRLGPGDCFGEAGVLTGASTTFRVKALTKAVVYEIAKDDLAPILKERPAITAELGHILARREAMGKKLLEQHAVHDSHGNHLADRLASRMRDIFGL